MRTMKLKKTNLFFTFPNTLTSEITRSYTTSNPTLYLRPWHTPLKRKKEVPMNSYPTSFSCAAPTNT
jgi:hypothetical protein